MVERIPIWCSDNNNNFNIIDKMRLESDILRDAINDCGSMIRKYQDDLSLIHISEPTRR